MVHPHRRHFLIGAAGTVGAIAGLGAVAKPFPAHAQASKPLPNYASWKDAQAVIVHTEKTLETKRGELGTSVITPADSLYVRNNLNPPTEAAVADRDGWEVSVDGVANARSLKVGELKKLGIATIATVLQCSGNGRDFFDHEASGTQWRTGAAGCLLWSGVPVRAVVDELGGLVQSANFVTATGGEELPKDIDPKTVVVERSVPIDVIDNAILAWEMNGNPVPIANGGPLRLIVPGYYGINNVKYVKRLAFTESESDAAIQRTGYRVRPIGVDGDPDQPSMWKMKVKSWITHPLSDQESGLTQIYGVAFGGMNSVEKVEVSTDGGANWQQATWVGPDLGRFAWRVFVLPAKLEPGRHSITSRATDAEGNVQSQTTEPNHRGYDYSGWDRLAVEVQVA